MFKNILFPSLKQSLQDHSADNDSMQYVCTVSMSTVVIIHLQIKYQQTLLVNHTYYRMQISSKESMCCHPPRS
jgi:hypothetical protein